MSLLMKPRDGDRQATCEHKRTRVADSRPPSYSPHGTPQFRSRAYPCVMIRRRVCHDCGARFSTAEVPLDWLNAFSDPKQIRRDILRDIRNFVVRMEIEALDTDLNRPKED